MATYEVVITNEMEAALTEAVAQSQDAEDTVESRIQSWVTQQAKQVARARREHEEGGLILALREASPAQRQEIKTILGL